MDNPHLVSDCVDAKYEGSHKSGLVISNKETPSVVEEQFPITATASLSEEADDGWGAWGWSALNQYVDLDKAIDTVKAQVRVFSPNLQFSKDGY